MRMHAESWGEDLLGNDHSGNKDGGEALHLTAFCVGETRVYVLSCRVCFYVCSLILFEKLTSTSCMQYVADCEHWVRCECACSIWIKQLQKDIRHQVSIQASFLFPDAPTFLAEVLYDSLMYIVSFCCPSTR